MQTTLYNINVCLLKDALLYFIKYKASFILIDCIYVFFDQGVLSNNNIVAVKQLYMESRQITDEFINEIVLITNLQHRNLVHLKGYSFNGKEMLLIYDYIDNYDLEKFLHGELSFEPNLH